MIMFKLMNYLTNETLEVLSNKEEAEYAMAEYLLKDKDLPMEILNDYQDLEDENVYSFV